MNTRASFPTSVCSEYEALLHRCKAYMDKYRDTSDETPLRGEEENRRKEILERLLEQYERSYARLVYHFDRCRRCQMSRSPRRRAPAVARDGSARGT